MHPPRTLVPARDVDEPARPARRRVARRAVRPGRRLPRGRRLGA
nr:hypothetical protein [Angustibacter aerolatus]